jgi:hypothetical protein
MSQNQSSLFYVIFGHGNGKVTNIVLVTSLVFSWSEGREIGEQPSHWLNAYASKVEWRLLVLHKSPISEGWVGGKCEDTIQGYFCVVFAFLVKELAGVKSISPASTSFCGSEHLWQKHFFTWAVSLWVQTFSGRELNVKVVLWYGIISPRKEEKCHKSAVIFQAFSED